METKVTEWAKCKDGPWHPTLSHGGYVAYRIWKQFDGLRWFQRHEWKAANGEIKMDDWIPSTRGWDACSIDIAEAS